MPISQKFLLAILNSKLVFFVLDKVCGKIRGGYFMMAKQYVQTLPIVLPNENLKNELVKLVDSMLTLNKEKQQTTLPEKLEQLQQRINYTDKKIDSLVYQLYGLTEEEITIVEQG